jgi:hypothetical protein
VQCLVVRCFLELPNREQAFIQLAKLTDYLLSKTHAVGRSKAKFFRELGFSEDTVSLLEKELLAIARTQDVVEALVTDHGIKYVIVGRINTLVNRKVNVLTVWIIDTGKQSPRFVTARPYLAQIEGSKDD